MTKVENSIWRCTVPSRTSETGECDATVIQQEMEEHLRRDHKRRLLSPGDVIPFFVLVRTAEVPRGPGRRGKIEDETMTMFDPGKDFR